MWGCLKCSAAMTEKREHSRERRSVLSVTLKSPWAFRLLWWPATEPRLRCFMEAAEAESGQRLAGHMSLCLSCQVNTFPSHWRRFPRENQTLWSFFDIMHKVLCSSERYDIFGYMWASMWLGLAKQMTFGQRSFDWIQHMKKWPCILCLA